MAARLLLLLIACAMAMHLQAAAAATVYYGGDILTMAGTKPQYVQALAAKDGKIVYVGSKDGALKAAGPGARLRDLKGRTLLPGFIDTHAHFILYAHNSLNAELRGVKDIPELLARLKAHAKTLPASGAWLEGMGYATSQMREGRHPTKEELDTVSTTVPILLQDSSGHHAVANSLMLKQLGISKSTRDPQGGVYYRKPGSQEPDGHMAEKAVMEALAKRPPLSPARLRKGFNESLQLWLSNGYTTAAELGLGLSGDDVDMVKTIIDQKLLPIDLVLYVKIAAEPVAQAAVKAVQAKYGLKRSSMTTARYFNRVKANGVKVWLDGSLPTALMSTPFANNPSSVPAGEKYWGVQVDSTADLEATVNRNWKNGPIAVAVHALGDQAVELAIQAMEKAFKAQGPTTKRHSIQHAGFVRPDQIQRVKRLGAFLAFSPGSIQDFGNYVVQLYGPQKANLMMPAASATKAGVPWVVNTDHPAGAGSSLLFSVQDIVNRVTRDGKVIAPAERVTPYQALRAITWTGAWAHNEEARKGSLEPGKLADLVILDKNPLKVPPQTIGSIAVQETIKEGRPLWVRSSGRSPAPKPAAAHADSDGEEHHHTANPYTPPISEAQKAVIGQLFSQAGSGAGGAKRP